MFLSKCVFCLKGVFLQCLSSLFFFFKTSCQLSCLGRSFHPHYLIHTCRMFSSHFVVACRNVPFDMHENAGAWKTMGRRGGDLGGCFWTFCPGAAAPLVAYDHTLCDVEYEKWFHEQFSNVFYWTLYVIIIINHYFSKIKSLY